MILDSSAVIAVLREEDGDADLVRALEGVDVVAIGAPTLLETEMVAAGRWGENGRAAVTRFREKWAVEVLAFDGRHSRAALDAFTRYGRGSGHPAKLNYGDCMAYATARVAQMPLLFTGEDFAKTDIPIA
ncbi:MAG TPA: type II toxin-antitoxin system VapC family toxin [Solirubrobacterales bacterium]